MVQVNQLSLVNEWLERGNTKKLYINGEWINPIHRGTMPVMNPAKGTVLTEVASASEEDVEVAIKAARNAFDNGDWSTTAPRERARKLMQLADKIEENMDLLAEIEVMNNGKTMREAREDVEGTIETFQYYASLSTTTFGETYDVEAPFLSRVVREPVGVCGQIIPWNYPLLMAAWKLAPAVATGNTCILKPSELTPLSAIFLFELIDEVGFPKGVLNLINGYGLEAGQPMVESIDVDKIAFTGGTDTGKKIIEKSVGNLKRVSLELGGKSPNIIFADADYESALDYAAFAIFNNAGQVCSAGSRLLVEKSIYQQFVQDLVKATKRIRVGNGLNPSSQMGSLISEQQLNKIQEYIEIGKNEGAKLVCGGSRLMANGLANGYFIEPTIFSDVNPASRIAQEEIFGPVLSIIPFETEAEAIQIANGTRYGLAAGIFTSDVSKAERVAKSIRVGVIWINTYEQTFIEGPWGGYKESGIGRELGVYGFNEYTEIKHIVNTMKVEPTNWFTEIKE